MNHENSAGSTVLLATGEAVSLSAVEITSIPDVTIIKNDNKTSDSIILTYKDEMVRFLHEIYQQYKFDYNYPEVALELLWVTKAVKNQPYNANISLYIIVRSINRQADLAEKIVRTLLELCRSVLNAQKYEFRPIGYEELSETVGRFSDGKIAAVVKEEKVENLQNNLVPFCYSYDRFPLGNQDMSRLVNTLIERPDCAVSIQLIPCSFSAAEADELSRMTQALDTLHHGVSDRNVGNVSYSFAKKQAALYKYYAQNKNSALFHFNIIVYGDAENTSGISSGVYSQINSDTGNAANIKTIPLDGFAGQKDKNFYPFPWAINEYLLSAGRNQAIWSSNQISKQCYRLPYIITAEEAGEVFRLPIGNEKISAGFVVNASDKNSRVYAENIINAGDIEVGRLKSSSRGDAIGFSLKDLTKHMLIVGTPGSGKTTFSVGMLDRLWKEHNIPFLVIEPAKNEYRALVQSIPELQVFTPGKNFISPFVFNPFVPPKNVKLETYKSTLKTAFAAAVSMSTPLDKIFEESVNNCYSDFRWLDTYTNDDKGKVFNISDFIKCFQQTFDDIGYTGDARNIGRAGVVRLNSLANLFDCYHSIPIEDLLTKPTVIELAAIENSDQKALIISLLLLSILAYVNSNYVGKGDLCNLILLEEAHVLLDADSGAASGEANPSAIAQGLIKRMLAELRSYGVGLAIADQSPRKVTADVVALTDIKLAFRLVEASDKQIMADSSNMSAVQVQRLSKLKPGEALLFFGKLDEPEEIKTEDYRLNNEIDITLSDEGIQFLSTYWNEREALLRPYPECGYTPYCKDCCDYSRRVLAREVARRIFVKNIKPDSADFNLLRGVFGNISKRIEDELNDEVLDRELLSCTKVHLFRRIYYGSKIPVPDTVVRRSLEKE